MRRKYRVIICLLAVLLVGSLVVICGGEKESLDSINTDALVEDVPSDSMETSSMTEEIVSGDGEEFNDLEGKSSASEFGESLKNKNDMEREDKSDSEDADGDNQEDTNRILDFVDVYGEHYQVQIDPEVESHNYKLEAFKHQGDKISYEDVTEYEYRLGVDVSHHQGKIDWKKVKADGFDFVFLRIGYRGYGTGSVNLDREFNNNIEAAKEAGLDIGVYFFSQAINEEEAEEEAEFVLKALDGCELQLPVVYDPESILDDEARTDDIEGEQFTQNTIRFCEKIKEAGYEPMIYSNMLWEAYEFDLTKLSDYEIWYADYEPLPQTPYHFTFWQYYNQGKVDGVNTLVDMNIQLIPIEGGKKEKE